MPPTGPQGRGDSHLDLFHLPKQLLLGAPIGLSSGRGPHFIAEAVQSLAKVGVKWDLHTPWRPQTSGKVERMNQSLKGQISKICQEAQMKWPDALPLALL